MAARPTVSVYSASQDKVVGSSPLPAVFTAPIRNDIVQFVHKEMAKNGRQAYAVNRLSGMKHSAVSWGTGRAVARIPRVKGSGTHAAAAGAFGNQCRNGRMFAPTKTYRRWHRRINLHQKRYAVTSALAASAVPALLMARGHKVENIAEVPLVVEDAIQQYTKTKDAVAFLEAVRAMDDVNRVNDSKHVRAGAGKQRNRRYVQRRGPMLVLPDNTGVRAFRNIFGLDLANVNALNLLSLAPGGHLGRFVIWTQDAFEELEGLWGNNRPNTSSKAGFQLPRAPMTNTDLTRIINSDEIQSVLREKATSRQKPSRKRNALTNFGFLVKLNPHAKVQRRSVVRAQIQAKERRASAVDAARKAGGAKKRAAIKTRNADHIKALLA